MVIVRNRVRALVAAACVLMLLSVGLTIVVVGALQTASSAAPTIPSSQGTDFWLTFESNCAFNGCGPYSGPGTLFLFISGSTATTGTVTDSAASFSQSFSVTPGTTTEISVPSSAEDDTSDSVEAGSAVHITATSPVSAYGLNTIQYTTDGFMGLPTTTLGTSYIAEGYGGGFGSQFAVVGSQASTTVTITPSEDVGSYTAGTPYTETLNQGDVYQLVDTSGGDLSGTTITSTKPVAVFAGNDCANVPPSDSACNTLAEEMIPTTAWGEDFLTEPLATRSGDTFRFMASEDNTTVDVDGSTVATLNAGQLYETILTSASTVTANNPIQVMQYSNGQEYDGANADPFDITIPPTEQFLNSYTVATEPSGADPAITQNYLNIVAPTSEISSIDLDGTPLPSSDFTAITGSSYSGAQVAVDFGSHNVSGPLPFGLSVYGFGGYDGYGYPGGFTVSPIATVAKVSLAPMTSSDVVGTSECETATVTDSNGNPVSGVLVNFSVTGANPNTGFAYSASDGTAPFCYTGTAQGGDTETAAVGSITSNAAMITWTQTSTSESTTLSGGGQMGSSISVPMNTAVTDSATLSGANASTATGTVTYTVYSDSGCTAPVGTPMSESITTPGTLPSSASVSLPTPGTYYWQAFYSGDSANQSSMSTCGPTGEVEMVTGPVKTQTTLATSLSGGGQTGSSISVSMNTAVTDSATLSGANASTATGTVTYTVYSDSACTTAVSSGLPESITTPGSLPPSAPVSLTTPGTYYWQASYSGDGANVASTSACGSTGEVETVTGPAKAKGTKLDTLLTGSGVFGGNRCWWTGNVITVFAQTAVTDTASLGGVNVASAGGTMTYTVYGLAPSSKYRFGRWQPVASGGTVTVTNGSVPNSNSVTLPPGFYEWQAVYSGDATNAPSSSRFGSEAEIVVPAPQCHNGWNRGMNGGCKPQGGGGKGDKGQKNNGQGNNGQGNGGW